MVLTGYPEYRVLLGSLVNAEALALLDLQAGPAQRVHLEGLSIQTTQDLNSEVGGLVKSPYNTTNVSI
jgi:hypothetical protein